MSIGSETLRETSQELRAVVEDVSDEALQTKLAADATNENLIAAANAAHAASDAMDDLRQQSETSAVRASDAAALMKIGNTTILSLSEAVSGIGSVADAISAIATQNQPPSLKCHDRSCSGRRSWTRLRRCRGRSQNLGSADIGGDLAHCRADHRN